MEDHSLDEPAAELIVRLNRLHSSLGSLAAPAGRETAALLGYGWWTRVVRSAEAMRLLHSHALSRRHQASGRCCTTELAGAEAGLAQDRGEGASGELSVHRDDGT
jgi:hypothetical protein